MSTTAATMNRLGKQLICNHDIGPVSAEIFEVLVLGRCKCLMNQCRRLFILRQNIRYTYSITVSYIYYNYLHAFDKYTYYSQALS